MRISSAVAAGFDFAQNCANGGPRSGSSPPPAAMSSRAQFNQMRAVSRSFFSRKCSAATPIAAGVLFIDAIA